MAAAVTLGPSPRPSMPDDMVPGGWVLDASQGGVRVWTRGEGPPVFIFSGLEGSGESALHLAVPVLSSGLPRTLFLLDYSQETHDSFGDLISTLHALILGRIGDGADAWFWSQSYGNLLACSVLARRDLVPTRHVLVSPFTKLPAWKPLLTPPVLAVTPGFLYRLVIGPIAEWQFGPSQKNFDHPFFGSLKAITPGQLRKRTAWIRGLDFQNLFEEVFAQQGTRRGVWFGDRDRLVDIAAQMRWFDDLCARTGAHMETVVGAGHVVLPPGVILDACQRLFRWVWRPDPS